MSKQRVMFFVGSDMTGKTNIAQAIAKQLGIAYFKNKTEWATFERSPQSFINDLRFGEPRQIGLLKATGASVVFDRGYPCEWVYSKQFRRQTDEQLLSQFDATYASMSASIVICHRSSYDGLADDRFPDKLDAKTLAELDKLYQQFARWTKCRTFMLNVDFQPSDGGNEAARLDRQLNEIRQSGVI